MRTKVIKVREGLGDRHPLREDRRQPVERPPAYCRSCINLLYLDGIVRCAEYKFLLSPEDLVSPIDCPKFTPLSSIKTFKIFTGTANKMDVVEEMCHEAVVRTAAKEGRGATLLEVARLLTVSRKTAFRILQRLEASKKVAVSKIVITYKTPIRRKTWKVNAYWPKILEGKVENKSD